MVSTLRNLLLVLSLFFPIPMVLAGNVIPEMLTSYEVEGVADFDAAAGEALWRKNFAAPADEEDQRARNCQTCHGPDLTKLGEHARTGKTIEPMALSVNAERFTEVKKIKKWFRRNCKWVMGRACTAQEKGNILLYLQSQ